LLTALARKCLNRHLSILLTHLKGMLENIILTFEAVGTLLIAWAALRVHHRILNEHNISKTVFRIMRIEQRLGILGMILVFVGYVLNILY